MTDATVVKPYGSWASPLSAERIAEAGVGLSFVRADGKCLYWLEGRPRERGRSVLMRYRKGEVREVLPAHFDVRSRVHEYGGGAYAAHGGRVVFSQFPGGRVWLLEEDGEPRQITPDAALRYADFVFASDGIYAVREDHRGPGEPVNSVVLLDPDRIGEGDPLCSGRDFYAAPRPGPERAPRLHRMGPSQYAVGCDRAAARRRGDCGRGGRIGGCWPAHLGVGWAAPLHLGPLRLVEPLCP